ncbi:cytochrome c biogenesis protein CcsA [Lacibacterium aquatile]|uniref:Cytochrome c biogenesis protein CcsA n=1 Tax=Lacibacterium aquatile TaxID=1168082 RepID=A0ABW5DRD7_9PROT
MNFSMLVSVMAAATLLPAMAMEWLRAPDVWRRASLVFAGIACIVVAGLPDFGGSFARAVWGSLAMVLALFLIATVMDRGIERLGPLLVAYCGAVGLLAVPFSERQAAGIWSGTALLHILPGLAGYALITLAAIAAVAADMQARALKARRVNWLLDRLPPLNESERHSFRFLIAAAVALSIAVSAGMALNWTQYGTILRIDHKAMLTLVALAATAGLLGAHAYSGLRGRQAVRWVLGVYLLLTLAFPGAKFVGDIVLGRG